jgi:hypothetical protein
VHRGQPCRNTTTAVARGDLSRKITVEVKGEILELKNTINAMVDQLNGFASEVTCVAREVGTEPYSSAWGYYPSGGLGLVLLILVVLLLLGRI